MKDIFKSLLTFLSVIIFFVTLMLLIVMCNVSHFFTADNITKGILKMDVAKALHEMENSNVNGNKVTEILDNAYIVAEYYKIPSSVIDEMVNNSSIKEFFGMTAGNITDYIVNGRDNKILTSKEFNKILDDNIDDWIKASNSTVTDQQKKDFLDTVKKQSGQIIDNLPNSSSISKKLGINYLDDIHKIFNNNSKIIIGIIMLISLLSIIMLHWKNHRNIIYVGYTCLIAGIITIGIGLMSSDLMTIVLSKSGVFLDVSLFSTMLMKQFIFTGIICIGISLILYILHLILKKINLN